MMRAVTAPAASFETRARCTRAGRSTPAPQHVRRVPASRTRAARGLESSGPANRKTRAPAATTARPGSGQDQCGRPPDPSCSHVRARMRPTTRRRVPVPRMRSEAFQRHGWESVAWVRAPATSEISAGGGTSSSGIRRRISPSRTFCATRSSSGSTRVPSGRTNWIEGRSAPSDRPRSARRAGYWTPTASSEGMTTSARRSGARRVTRV